MFSPGDFRVNFSELLPPPPLLGRSRDMTVKASIFINLRERHRLIMSLYRCRHYTVIARVRIHVNGRCRYIACNLGTHGCLKATYLRGTNSKGRMSKCLYVLRLGCMCIFILSILHLNSSNVIRKPFAWLLRIVRICGLK